MRNSITIILITFGLAAYSQNSNTKTVSTNKLFNSWYESPAGTHGDTILFKTIKHILGPNDDPAYAWSEFEMKSDNTFSINYWRWCPSGNYAYNGTWSETSKGNYLLDFGVQKCKCEVKLISVTSNELRAIIKEKTN
jgi:hypothetical protein